jgi:hypothetical protein
MDMLLIDILIQRLRTTCINIQSINPTIPAIRLRLRQKKMECIQYNYCAVRENLIHLLYLRRNRDTLQNVEMLGQIESECLSACPIMKPLFCCVCSKQGPQTAWRQPPSLYPKTAP